MIVNMENVDVFAALGLDLGAPESILDKLKRKKKHKTNEFSDR